MAGRPDPPHGGAKGYRMDLSRKAAKIRKRFSLIRKASSRPAPLFPLTCACCGDQFEWHDFAGRGDAPEACEPCQTAADREELENIDRSIFAF